MVTLAVALFSAALPNAVVLEPVANMYSRPSRDADVVSQAIYGANVAVVAEQDGFLRIRTSDDYTGWIPSASLNRGAPYAASGKTAEVQSLFAHIYREASVTRHAPLLTVPFETRLEIAAEPHGDAPDWYQVRLPDDRAGWIQAGDVALQSRKLSISEMIDFSKRFLGLPYTWGGASSFGYDCSGFSQMLARLRGVSLPRDAQPQADWSGVEPIAAREDLQPGDLLFFGGDPAKITHTGIYIGDGKFIDATTYQTPAIRIDDLNDPHWAGLLVAMRRIK